MTAIRDDKRGVVIGFVKNVNKKQEVTKRITELLVVHVQDILANLIRVGLIGV